MFIVYDGEEDNRRKKKIGNEVEISGHTFTAWVRWSKSMVNINMCTIPTTTYITRCTVEKRKREKREREKIHKKDKGRIAMRP